MPHLLSVADPKKLAYRPPLMDIGALRHDHSLQALWGVLYGAASTWGEHGAGHVWVEQLAVEVER